MHVVLDTSVVFGDPLFTNANAQVLLGHSGARTYKIVLPAAVVLEHKKKLRAQISEQHNKLTSAAGALERRGVNVGLPVIDPVAQAEAIHNATMNRLRQKGVVFPPSPTISHDEFAQRSVDELKPWGTKSRGYRDALIWETVKELAQGGPVLLATHNSDDFCDEDDKSKLHPDLINDLANVGIAPDQVEILDSVASAVRRLVTPAEQARRQLSDRLASDPEFTQAVEHEIETSLMDSQIEPWDSLSISDLPVTDVEIAAAAIEGFDLVSAFSVNDEDENSEIVVTFFADVQVQLAFAAPAGAEPYLNAIQGYTARSVGGWALTDTGWIPATYVAQARYDRRSQQLSSWSKASISDRDDV